MHFCTECQNMYYIRLSGEDENQLSYYCRKCGHEDTAIIASLENICVSRSDKKTISSYDHIINKYTKLDPTLPRLYHIKCPNTSCPANAAVESKDGSQAKKGDDDEVGEILYLRYDDANMKFVYICTKCDTVWKSADDK
jgi:DNA-directed RNA polymerase subunit M/transcription elongation factor TFIIS